MTEESRTDADREGARAARVARRTVHVPRPLPTRRHRRPRNLLVAGGLAALVIGWFLWSLWQPFHGDGHGVVHVSIPPHSSTGKVGDILAADGVVSSSFFFQLRVALSGERGKLEAGSFALAHGMSYGSAIDALTGTSHIERIDLLVAEGRWRREIATLARQAGVKGDYLAASASSPRLDPRRYGARAAASLEGFLYPARYEMPPGSTAQQLVAQQLALFKRNFSSVDLSYARHLHLTPYDVLTIASMVEEEAQTAQDRPLIAAVIYNRLHANTPLGIDATTRYEFADRTGTLTTARLRAASPYNTRNRRGLPPTPVGNPGLASMRAAAHPARVSYLYYVLKPCSHGAHAFSTTFAQFQADVARYRSGHC